MTQPSRATLPLMLLCTLLALAACAGSGTGSEPGPAPGSADPSSLVPAPSGSTPGTPSLPGTPLPSASAPEGTLPPAGATTSLTVEFSADGSTPTDSWTLHCNGSAALPESTAPDPAGACAVLAAQGTALFAAVPADRMCTQQISGPQRARVTGTVNGENVDASFSLTDGCQTERWEKLTPLLGPASNVR